MQRLAVPVCPRDRQRTCVPYTPTGRVERRCEGGAGPPARPSPAPPHVGAGVTTPRHARGD